MSKNKTNEKSRALNLILFNLNLNYILDQRLKIPKEQKINEYLGQINFQSDLSRYFINDEIFLSENEKIFIYSGY